MNETTAIEWETLWEGIPPHASEAAIQAAEAAIGVRFPEAFRAVLRTHQGQMPTPSCVAYADPDGAPTWVDIGAFYHVEPDAEAGDFIVHRWTYLQDYFEGDEDRFPNGFPAKLVPIADDPGGSPVCLDYRAGGEPSVVRVQYHDRFHDRTLEPVAPSFDAFLAGLHQLEEGPGEDRTPEALPGLPVRVSWPVGFTPMDGFPGVANPETQASIVVHAFPAPFDELAAGMTRENLLKRGVRLDGLETLTLDEGRRALLIRCAQSAQDVEVDKWILVLEGDGRTALLTATYPVREAPAMAAPLREALLTARWVDSAPEQPTLRLGQSPLLTYAATTSGLDVYTPNGQFVPGQRQAAVMFAGYGMAPIRGEEAQRRFCTDRIGNVDDDLMGVTITTMRPIELDGLHGFEGQAVGTSRADGRRQAVYQVVLFEPDRYVILVGLTDEDVAERYVPAFQAIAGGFAGPSDA